MASSEWDARKGNPLFSPTQLTQRRGLRRPTPVKSLSGSQSSSQSISSRATSRRSKSFVSTPEEQRLFENISASLAILTPTADRNKLKRFQQKKAMACSTSFTPSSNSKKMIHPTQQPSFQDRSIKDGSETERYFSQGGSLAIDKPGKVTPIIYIISTSNSSDSSSDESGNTHSFDSDAFVPLPQLNETQSDEDTAFVPLPQLNETQSDEDAFTDLEAEQIQSPKSSVGREFHSTVDASSSDFSSTTQSKDNLMDGTEKQTTSTLIAKSPFKEDDDDFSTDNDSSFDGRHIGCNISESNREANTLNQFTATSTSKLATMGPSRSTVQQSTFGQSSTPDRSTLDQPKSTLSATEQEYTQLDSTSPCVINQFGEEITSSHDRSKVQSTIQSDSASVVIPTEVSLSDRANDGRGKCKNSIDICQMAQSNSVGHSATNSLDARSATVRTVETNFSDRGTSKSVENVVGTEMTIQYQTSNSSDVKYKAKKRVDKDTEEEEDYAPISTSISDVSEITTLSRAQRHTQPIPVMNYSNIFSTGSTSIWSRNENLKRDDDIFMSRAQTLLDFYEARLNADKTELLLVPGDKKEIESKFNAKTRLRFVESLRMRCVVKNERTEEIVQRCCLIGLEKEGAHNPIFATGALGNRKIRVIMPTPAIKKDDQSDKGETDTDSLAISQLSCDSAEWGRNKGSRMFGSYCSPQLCDISFFCA